MKKKRWLFVGWDLDSTEKFSDEILRNEQAGIFSIDEGLPIIKDVSSICADLFNLSGFEYLIDTWSQPQSGKLIISIIIIWCFRYHHKSLDNFCKKLIHLIIQTKFQSFNSLVYIIWVWFLCDCF